MSKVVIITGASRGIGRELAKQLSISDFNVVANYNNSYDEALQLKKELNLLNKNIDIFKADVSKRIEVKDLINFTLSKYGKIDILINNAGISKTQLFQDVSDDDWNTLINNNLYSAFCVTQECLPTMINQKSGCIINISSVWGMVGSSCESIYSISKAGIDAMTKSLAKELGPSNIRVNSIAPGFIDTDMNKHYSNDDFEAIKSETPLGKIGKPYNIAQCVKWLIDDTFTTGQIISINGGWIIN